MTLGLADRRGAVSKLLKRRLFPTRVRRPERWRLYYERRLVTRALPRNAVHQLKYTA